MRCDPSANDVPVPWSVAGRMTESRKRLTGCMWGSDRPKVRGLWDERPKVIA